MSRLNNKTLLPEIYLTVYDLRNISIDNKNYYFGRLNEAV